MVKLSKNVQAEIDGSVLTLTIDLAQRAGVSEKGTPKVAGMPFTSLDMFDDLEMPGEGYSLTLMLMRNKKAEESDPPNAAPKKNNKRAAKVEPEEEEEEADAETKPAPRRVKTNKTRTSAKKRAAEDDKPAKPRTRRAA